MKTTLVLLSTLLSSVVSFAPLAPSSPTLTSLFASPAVDQKAIGVLRPMGLFDPLDLMSQSDADFTRRRTSEIKHGRVAMVAVIGNLAPQLGLTFPGYISTSEGVKFSDVAEAGSFGALAKIPAFGVAQIALFAAIIEVSCCYTPHHTTTHHTPPLSPSSPPLPRPHPYQLWTWKQDSSNAPGDVGGRDWVRYQDPVVKTEKLNKELQNGRLAMLAISGLMVQEQITGKGAIEMLGY